MIKEAIILAGGMGTRLKSVITDIPKPMAPVGDRPFLAIILDNLNDQGIEHVILAVGYKYKVIQSYFKSSYKNITINYAIEKEPLGTGGAVSLAIDQLYGNDFFMMNGDTLFDVDLYKMSLFHIENNAQLSLALKPIHNQDRYGLVVVDQNNRVIQFKEKQYTQKGLINGGVYIASKRYISSLNLPQKYSWESEVLEAYSSKSNIFGLVSDCYFIDIGIPEDYNKAQIELV